MTGTLQANNVLEQGVSCTSTTPPKRLLHTLWARDRPRAYHADLVSVDFERRERVTKRYVYIVVGGRDRIARACQQDHGTARLTPEIGDGVPAEAGGT